MEDQGICGLIVLKLILEMGCEPVDWIQFAIALSTAYVDQLMRKPLIFSLYTKFENHIYIKSNTTGYKWKTGCLKFVVGEEFL